MRPLHLLAFLTIGVIWGAGFMFIKVMVEDGLSPLAVSWVRTAGGLLMLGVIAASGRRPPRTVAYWRDVVVLAALGSALPFFLISWATREIPSNLAGILNGAVPFWAVIFTALYLRAERMTWTRTAGVLVGFAGVAVVIGLDAFDLRSASTQGQLAMVAATASLASAAVYARRQLPGRDPMTLAAAQTMVALLMLSVPLAATGDVLDVRALERETVLAALGLAVLVQAVAVMLFFWLLSQVEATQATLVTYVVPISALFWGWLVLGEVPSPLVVPGVVLILLGIYIVNRRVAAAEVAAPVPAR